MQNKLNLNKPKSPMDGDYLVITYVKDTGEEVTKEKITLRSAADLQARMADIGRYNARQVKLFESGIIPRIKVKKLITN